MNESESRCQDASERLSKLSAEVESMSNALQEAETRASQETRQKRFLYGELRALETEKKHILEQVC